LSEHFIQSICNEYGTTPKKITPKALKALKDVNWTGNIRELRNVIERLIILSDKEITEQDVLDYVKPSSANKDVLQDLFSRFDDFNELKDHLKKEYNAFRN